MSALAATRGTFADFKLIKGRKVAQLVIEVPIEQADAAVQALGGLPNPSTEAWVALARLHDGAASERREDRRSWADLPPAQQAGIRCGEPDFQAFVGAHDIDSAANKVRAHCGIKTRQELATNHKARVLWHSLDAEFQARSGRMAEARR